jgi:conserved oligomeric Golgi complex subunit 2
MNQNYTTSKAFLSALEYLAPDLHAVQSMREHPIYATFERRWQLPVYFQLRWKEIVGDLEMSLNENRPRLSLGII